MDQVKTVSPSTFLGVDFNYLLSEWKQMFKPETLPKDIWAGITVALVALPLNLALAIAAGVEPGIGITTGIIAGIIGGLFGGQKFAITGPAAAMAVVLIEVAHNYGINAIWLVCLIAGALQLIAGCFKFGKLISYLPMPVIVGFANAIGVLVFFNAIDDFLGLPAKHLAHAGQSPFASIQLIPEFIIDLMHIVYRCVVHHEMNFYAILIGTITLAIAYWTPKVTKAVPGQLVAIIAGTTLANLLHFDIPVIKSIASIPNTLPTPTIPHLPWHDLSILFPTIVTVFLLGSIESLLSASVADGMTGSSRHHSNQELIGQGLANIIVPFFGGIPVTGVIARTAVNIRSGARTRLSAIVHSLVLMCLIFFVAKYAEQIPLAALAAILMLTGIRLFEWHAIREIWKGSKTELLVSAATTIAAVAVDLTAGVFAGLLFAAMLFIKQMSDVKFIPQDISHGEELVPNLPTCKFVRTYVIDGPLFFAAAERFIENIVVVDNIKVIILHMKAARVIDLTGVETLLSIEHQLRRQGGKLVIAELPQQSFQFLKRTGALDKIGPENVYDTYRDAVINVNDQLLSDCCKTCGKKSSGAPKDCRLHNALLDESSPMSRMLQTYRSKSNENKSGIEWLFPVESAEDIPKVLQDTPIATLLEGQNLGLIDDSVIAGPELIIGMCMDFRKSLSIPRDWAFMIRREGANMDGSEFAIALAVSKGVRHMALIAHNQCAMSNTAEHKEAFVDVLSKQFGWNKKTTIEFFDNHARNREIGNEIDFALEEAQRLALLFPGLNVVPMLFRLEDDRIYLIYDWLSEHCQNDPVIMNKLAQLSAKKLAVADTQSS